MDTRKCNNPGDLLPSSSMGASVLPNKMHGIISLGKQESATGRDVDAEVDIDIREIYFLIVHFLSAGPCQKTLQLLCNELSEHHLWPRRYHAWFSRSGVHSGDKDDDGTSFPLNYSNLVERYPHIEKDHLAKLLKELMLCSGSPFQINAGAKALSAVDVPTLLGTGSFSLLDCERKSVNKKERSLPAYLRWPHMQADQVHGLGLREIGGGFRKHHRAPSVHSACYAIAKPSMMVQRMENVKKLRGHRVAVYCAIFDRSGRYVITGSDDRLVKIWSMETAFCLASCRGHEGDITDLAVTSNNQLVASASNDFVIRVWRLPDGHPISVLRGHTGAVTAIVFNPRPSSAYQLLSSSDDGTCRIWDARSSQCAPRIYVPKPPIAVSGKNSGPSVSGPSSSASGQSHQILCCAYNANGTVFVSGSSDTFARVWNAFKSNTDDPEQPIHEMDILSGHENDVNYVQFSGCSVAPRSSSYDTVKEENENIPKFKNSWFCHDNIVTCSRDGSAIIWVPKSRRPYGKGGRWERSYHLKVPSPPLPPQPPRGGPRQRFLPTPRGVNMIVWSLDNHFVLAAIMDCRICVWNASDGSLVHSLTGHNASSYVLDVHPFDPRIAMSAGYDGKAIIWDIWEGTPIRTYDIGRVKLVDGKFSPDGTSIVLSDDFGQIHLVNTGQGESQKDAKYDQFFLGDYRPLIRDILGNVLDQESQLPPHRRNVQDPLCDASLIPYPEPYQSMYQKRRLGALGLEWHPSPMQFAIGPDFILGQDYQMPPLADVERMMEPLPEFLDAMFWEPENEIISDDNDSEYNAAEESSSEGDKGILSAGFSSDPECSTGDSDFENNHKDTLRRSGRDKCKTIDLVTSSRRRVKKRNLDECEGSTSRYMRIKKSKNRRKSSKRQSSQASTVRPQRTAARHALSMFSQISGTSSDGHEFESDSPSSHSLLEPLNAGTEDNEAGNELEQECGKGKGESAKPAGNNESPRNGNKKRLVLKFSLRDHRRPAPLEDVSSTPCDEVSQVIASGLPQANTGNSSAVYEGVGPHSRLDPMLLSEDELRNDGEENVMHITEDVAMMSTGENDKKIGLGEAKISSPICLKMDVTGSTPSLDVDKGCENHSDGDDKNSTLVALENQHVKTENIAVCEDGHMPLSLRTPNVTDHQKTSPENGPPKKLTILRIKTKGQSMKNSVNGVDGSDDVEGSVMKHDDKFQIVGGSTYSERELLDSTKQKCTTTFRQEIPCSSGLNTENINKCIRGHPEPVENEYDTEIDYPDAEADALRRTRSMKMKATSRETSFATRKHNFRGHESSGTSRSVEKSSRILNQHLLSEDWMPRSNLIVRSRSTRNRRNDANISHYIPEGRRSNQYVRKQSWLTLLEHEEGYRYVPQLGDEVVYLIQGHKECIESGFSRDKLPHKLLKGIRAVEICKVKGLEYATSPGSGDSCCKLALLFVDSDSPVYGKEYRFTLPDLTSSPDFVIEKSLYDYAIERNWTIKDTCLVWWRDENGIGGSWWEGQVLSCQAKSHDFSDSPWERYSIEYQTDPPERHLHSPWELHDPDEPWDRTQMDPEISNRLLLILAKLEHLVSKNKDYYGFQKLNEVAQKSDFANRFPVALSPELIQQRLRKNYYRSVEAVKHDLSVMVSNAESYFSTSAELSTKMNRLSDWFTKALAKL